MLPWEGMSYRQLFQLCSCILIVMRWRRKFIDYPFLPL
uniref:Uncharacterized protein n=1 Tax=Rhizophora mucronata TaxID=61149 RepID=A0A2P2PYE6_RHIMU